MEFVVDEVKCKECPLWETSYTAQVRRSGVYGIGSGRSGLWIYGENLNASDVFNGFPFSGESGDLLRSILGDVGLREDDLFLTASVRCKPEGAKKPKADHIKACMKTHALKDVPKTPPKLIVTLGSIALKAVLNLDKVTERRGVLHDHPEFNCKVLPTFHPKAILNDPRKYDTVKEDFIKAREFITEQTEKAPKIHREFINSKESYLRWMKILANGDLIQERYCDTETTGLIFFKDIFASISFAVQVDGEIYAIAFLTIPKDGWWHADLTDPEIHEALQQVLIYPIDFHNGLFDIKFFWQNGFEVNFGDDTTDMHLMIDENSPHNLQYLISIYNKFAGAEHHKKEFAELEFEKGEFYKAKPELLLDINIDDTAHGFILKKKFLPLMKAEGTYEFYNRLQMPFKRMLTRMSYRGIMMDRERIRSTSDEYRNRIRKKEEELYDAAKQKFKYTSTSKELPRVLYKDLGLPILKYTEKNSPSTDKEALEGLADLHPVPKLITELRFYKGMLQKYLDGDDLSEEIDPKNGFLNFLDGNDRIHGPFLSFGTISGRPSCPKPNLLNIPKNPEIRSLFIAQPGFKLVDFDYSQAEMVLLAYLAQDPQFMADVMDTDFHSATQKSLMKSDKADDIIRRVAKSINFLKSYGGGAEKLSKTLKSLEEKRFKELNLPTDKKFDVRCKNTGGWTHIRKTPRPIVYETVNKNRDKCYVCEAEEWLRKWDDTYPLVPLFKNEQKDLWRSQGFIKGIYGRKKRFPPAVSRQIESYYDRIAVNFMCQNGVGDAINTALIDIDFLLVKLFGWSPSTCLKVPGVVLSVYDSILTEVPDMFVDHIVEIKKEIMSAPLPQLNISLKMDINISQRWGEKQKEEVEEYEKEAV